MDQRPRSRERRAPSPSNAGGPAELPPVAGAYYANTPASLACVYGLVPRSGDGCNPYVVTRNPSGGSWAIAVVEAFDAPNAMGDLAKFSAQFGLPAPTPANFQVVYASAGACTTGGVKPGGYASAGRPRRASTSNGRTQWRPMRRSMSSRPPRTAPPIDLQQSPWRANAWPRTGEAKCR